MKPSIYEPFPAYPLKNRQWPDNTIDKPPIWCSVDLSEGAQALPCSMSDEKKWQFFQLLKKVGLKQIEIGMPGHCQGDFLFARRLIEGGEIPKDTVIQVMSKMKASHIDRSIEAVSGSGDAIVHLFHSTSSLRRESIYTKASEEEMLEHAIKHLLYAKEKASLLRDTKIHFQYSPEGFNTTEPTRLVKLCQAVVEVMNPNPDNPLIINFFEAVQTDTPNQFADRIEYVIREVGHAPYLTYSIRAHNDRGSAVGACELALLAGVERIEGTMLGTGSRTGTVSLVTLALNFYTQGVMPGLDLQDVNDIVATVEECTGETLSTNQPYVGEHAFSAFASHEQFSLNEALKQFEKEGRTRWHVPYLPLNPKDIGREKDAVIRLNHLSGRTGIAYVMKKYHGFSLPETLQKEFAIFVKEKAVHLTEEMDIDALNALFYDLYIRQEAPIKLRAICFDKNKAFPDMLCCTGKLCYQEETIDLYGEGEGALHATLNALRSALSLEMEIENYCQHALGHSALSKAASYVCLSLKDKRQVWGVGIDNDATLANILALISAVNRTMDMYHD